MHGDDGQDHGIDAVPVAGFLEVAVVLLAPPADAGVEVGARDVDHVVEVEVGWFPAVASQAGVEPVFGAGGGRLVKDGSWSVCGNSPVWTSSWCYLLCGSLGVKIYPKARVLGLSIPSSDEECSESRVGEFAHFQTLRRLIYKR